MDHFHGALWAQTRLREAAAESIMLAIFLSSKFPDRVPSLYPTIDAYQHGLLATWETTEGLLCLENHAA